MRRIMSPPTVPGLLAAATRNEPPFDFASYIQLLPLRGDLLPDVARSSVEMAAPSRCWISVGGIMRIVPESSTTKPPFGGAMREPPSPSSS